MEMLVNMDHSRRLCPLTDHFHLKFVVLVLFYLVWPAADAVKTPPPNNVVISQSKLNWNSTESDVTFTVESRKFESDWMPIETCKDTRFTSCDLSLDGSCIQYRVTAWRNRTKSEPVEACSRDGHPCAPNFTLTAAPESLTVILKRSHSLHKETADNLKHSIHFWKKGEQPKEHSVTLSSQLIDGLEVGETYCVTVQFVFRYKEYGPASCMQCETIPSSSGSKQTQIIVICIVLSGIVLLVVYAYVHLFKFKKIKEILQPPYTMPPMLIEQLAGHNYLPVAMIPTEEHLNDVSVFSPFETRGVGPSLPAETKNCTELICKSSSFMEEHS
ncbi:interferon gamma receptor 2 precursor [Poecilia latipinna]|uniref:Interferon gamma receptor 2 n=2 Tax=Poecilia TaxID=8080 RepID=A0A3B3VWE0_9TELE|nr:interferon gamma receptor 2 precursor [Poecilia latipinna]XP_014839644.1 PREDICTED: tissue factor-like [Poecilia mexicana]